MFHKEKIIYYFKAFVAFSLAAIVFVAPEALATPTGLLADSYNTNYGARDAISGVLCAIVRKFNGPLGKGISTIAIIVLGVGLFLGKLSWGVAVATAIGIGLIFGAEQMVQWIGNAAAAGQGRLVIPDPNCSAA